MTSESRKWESLKAEYLSKVEKALSSIRHPRGKEVLEDVRSHLDRRFAELEPRQQTWENFQTIMTEMGPASDYAELLDAHASSAGPAIGLKHLWWLALAGIVVVAAILLSQARPAGIAGYIVRFEPVGQFKPVTARQLLDAFNANHPRDVRTHHFRTQIKGDKLIGYICVDTEAAKDAIVSMLKESEKLTLIKASAATDAELEELYKMGQPSIDSAARNRFRALPESANRKLLDGQTLKQLRSHEEFSAGWFKVEQEYEAASDTERNKMVRQWMADAVSDDFEKITRAIAALGNVRAVEALDVLISVGQKPKKGNRPRWMAVRALGRIGDRKAIPLLINLLDHHNMDTRLYAKVALCEITGVYLGDSIQEWTTWAQTDGIQVEQMDVGPKAGENSQTRRTPSSRLRPSWSRNQTVTRSGSWPDGDCSLYGQIQRKAANSGVGHGKVCLSSEEFGSWTVEAQDDGRFEFRYIPAGIYSLRTSETLGYQDTFYDPENKNVEEPTFQIRQGQRIEAQIELKPLRDYHSVTGRILDEDGKPVPDHKDFIVCAWAQKPQRRDKEYYLGSSFSLVNEDGSYLLEELDARPVYIQVRDRFAQNKNDPYPPRFYPGTFSRADAELVTSEDKEIIENVDIPMKKTGGLALEGLVTDERTGAPVSEALVPVFRRDMPFAFFCGYTNKQGRYRIDGLGEGALIVHVDAVHKGLVKTRKYVSIEPYSPRTELDFTLTPGVTISGRFVDDKGDSWKVGRALGRGRSRRGDFGYNTPYFIYGNKYAPSYIKEGHTAFYQQGEGHHQGAEMVFPTENSFLLPALLPGETVIEFYPKRQGERLLKILYQGNDISRTGLVTETGQKIDDVTIVIGTSGGGSRQSRAETGDRLEFVLHDAFGREVRSQDYKGVPIFLEFGACW